MRHQLNPMTVKNHVVPTNEIDVATITIVLEIISIDDANITHATGEATQKNHKPITR